MKKGTFFWIALIALLYFMVSGTTAFAAKDVIYPSNASATVGGTVVTTTSNFPIGANGHTTLDNSVYAGDAVSVTATWSIQNNYKPTGTNTAYSRTVVFSTATSVGPPGADPVSVSSIGNCTVTSAASTCTTNINFLAPATIGTYQVMVTAADSVAGTGSNVRIEGTSLSINFTVAEVVGKLETELIVDQKCFTLNQGNVDLTATLQELVSKNKIAGATIDFYIDPELDINGDPTVPSIGSATTNTSGVAALSYNIDGLGAGDHNLYAEFAGNANYEASNDSDTLGISYLFLGFQQPINPEGNSIFGGRVIPIKIKLLDYNGYPVTDAAPTVWLTSFSQELGVGEVLEKVSSVSAADTDNIMRYVPEDQQYIYNWDATDLANGTYAVVVDLGDSATCRQGNPYAIITVSRKGKK